LSSYVSAFLIVAIEVAAAYYFIQKYDLGRQKSFLLPALYLGVAGFLAYIVGEVAAGASALGGAQIPLGQFLYYELAPTTLDYGNALIILLSLFGVVLLLKVLLKVNPLPKGKSGVSNGVPGRGLPRGAGFFGGLWTAGVTTAAAIVCCGPLPGAIALATGISSLYFTELISVQSLIIMISIPLILIAIVLADRRAMRGGCRLRRSTS
ncbi:MAG: hypothetical protein ACREBQ_13000, partial [Nitrososphaerales archaeon]